MGGFRGGRWFLALLLGLAACAHSPESEERYIVYCANQGLEPGGELFFDCVRSLRLRDRMEAQRIRDMRGMRPPDR